MLPKKAIAAVVIASFLLYAYKSLGEDRPDKLPNLLLGFALVGAFSAYQGLKEWISVF